MLDATIWMGLVWMLILGPAVGNYACSVVYRLPLGKTPFERHPFCGHCNADLKPKDLFPILSWLSTKGKCRYCRGPIPGIYTVIELACLLLFVANFLAFGMGEEFLLLSALGVFAIILAAIQWQQGWLSSSIYGYAFAFAALYSTLLEGSIFGWVQDFVIVMVLGLLAARLVASIRRAPFLPFETPWIWWLGLIAVAMPLPVAVMPLFVVVGVAAAMLAPRLSVAAFAFAVMALPVLDAVCV